MSPQITVVMPAYREQHDQISAAIESILNQTFKDFEYIILLDDPDNHELANLISNYAKKDSRIHFEINPQNMGCPGTKDRGIRMSASPYIAIMDADDIACPDRLEKQLQKIKSSSSDLIAGYVTVIDDKNHELYNMDNLPTTHEQIVKKLKINNCMPHPTWFLKKSMYLETGGYDQLQGCEDYDFLLRACDKGFKLGMEDSIVLKYRLSTQSISRNSLYKQYLMFLFTNDKYGKHKISEKTADEYVANHYTDKKASNFSKASVLIEKAIDRKSNKQYLKMLGLCLRAGFTSWEYDKKLLRYIRQEL